MNLQIQGKNRRIMRQRGFNKELKIKYKHLEKPLQPSKVISLVHSPEEALLLALIIDRFNYWADRGEIEKIDNKRYGFVLVQKDMMKVLKCSRTKVSDYIRDFKKRGWIDTVRDDGNQFMYIIPIVENILGLELELKDEYLRRKKVIDGLVPTIKDKRKAIKHHKQAKADKLIEKGAPKGVKKYDDYKNEQEERDSQIFGGKKVEEIKVTKEVIEDIKAEAEEELSLAGNDGQIYTLPKMRTMSVDTLKGLQLYDLIPKEYRPKKLPKVEQDLIESRLLTETVTSGFDGGLELPY